MPDFVGSYIPPLLRESAPPVRMPVRARRCACGCGERTGSMTSLYINGAHANRLASQLRIMAANGNTEALQELVSRGFKLPTTKLPKFGVEVEFWGMEQEDAVSHINSAGYEARDDGYHHEARNYWRVTEDGSVSHEGCELVSPILDMTATKGLKDTIGVVRVLRNNDARIDISCGLHVHHDARSKTVDDLVETYGMYALFQPTINLLVSASRRNNRTGYCALLRPGAQSDSRNRSESAHGMSKRLKEDPQQLRNSLYNVGRYFSINMSSYAVHGSLEFRQHQGTLNGLKIANWVRFTHLFMQANANGLHWEDLLQMYGSDAALNEELGVTGMLGFLGASPDLISYYETRAQELARRTDAEDDDADGGINDSDYDEEYDWTTDRDCDPYDYATPDRGMEWYWDTTDIGWGGSWSTRPEGVD